MEPAASPAKTFANDGILHIFLGYACNLNCAYCLQDTRTGTRQIRDIKPEVIEEWIRVLRERNIRKVAYWGGEPVLYWDLIVKIHTAFREAGLDLDHVRFATNGTLVEDHHIEKLNDWGAFIVISDHRRYGKPRWEVLRNARHCSVSFLFTHQELTAWNFFARLESLRQRYGRTFTPYVHWAHATKSCDESMRMTHADLPIHEKHLYELADMRLRGDHYARMAFEGHVSQYQAKMTGRVENEAMCFSDTFLAVDLDGKVFSCHHSSVPGNEIANSPFEAPTLMQRENFNRASRFVSSSECKACPIRFYCQGGCHMTLTHDVACRLAKIKAQVFDYIIEREK